MRMPMRLMPLLLTVLMLTPALLLPACTTSPDADPNAGERQVDWTEVRNVLVEAQASVQTFAAIEEDPERADELERVVAVADQAIAAVDQRIDADEQAQGDEAVVEAVRLALDVAGEAIAQWPNPEERAVASAVYVTVRTGLRLAHLRLQEADADDAAGPSGGGGA